MVTLIVCNINMKQLYIHLILCQKVNKKATWMMNDMYLLFEITNAYEITGVCSEHVTNIVKIKVKFFFFGLVFCLCFVKVEKRQPQGGQYACLRCFKQIKWFSNKILLIMTIQVSHTHTKNSLQKNTSYNNANGILYKKINILYISKVL